MRTAITGTPGTGKTTLAEELSERGYEVIYLKDFFEQKDIGEKENGERKIEIEELKQEFSIEELEDNCFVEGHLSHKLGLEACIVLRCNPEELESRLENRGYSSGKIQENLEAEAMDLILSEAVESFDEVREIDTTKKSVEEAADRVEKFLKGGGSEYGKVDWSEFL